MNKNTDKMKAYKIHKTTPQKASLEQTIKLLKEQILQLENDLRIRRKTARTIKKLLEEWNQQETDSKQSSITSTKTG